MADRRKRASYESRGSGIARGLVLVVEDDPINAKLARIVLEHGGYDVVDASDAEGARALLERFKPQVVLLDLRLPGMSGLELVRELRAHASTRDLLIVAMTASAMIGDAEIAHAAGCDGYLTKPIDSRTLADSIERFVTGRGRPARC